MAFDKKGFTPIHINSGAYAPRVFAYFSDEDLLSEIMEPGYFNSQKMIVRPNSFVKVVAKDASAEFVIDTNTPDVTFKDEFLRATDPYKDLVSRGKRRGKPKAGRKTETTEIAETG